MDINKNTCPCCPRGCDLSAPHCSRGKEYAETGIIPEGGHHHEHHDTSNVDANERLIHSLRMVSRTLNYRAEPTGGQDRVLSILAEKGTIGQKELMDTLSVKAGSLSELLGKLENAGLIVRSKNEEDHRAVNVALTEQGKKRAEEIAAQKGSGKDMFSALTEEEITQLTELLDKLAHDWRHRYSDRERESRQEPRRGYEQEYGRERGHEFGHEHERAGERGRERGREFPNHGGHQHEIQDRRDPGHHGRRER